MQINANTACQFALDPNTHRSLDKDAPVSRPVQRIDASCRMPWPADYITDMFEFEFPVHTGQLRGCIEIAEPVTAAYAVAAWRWSKNNIGVQSCQKRRASGELPWLL